MQILALISLAWFLAMFTVFALMLLGAHLYHAGQSGISPRLTLPRFRVSAPNGQEKQRSETFPEV